MFIIKPELVLTIPLEKPYLVAAAAFANEFVLNFGRLCLARLALSLLANDHLD